MRSLSHLYFPSGKGSLLPAQCSQCLLPSPCVRLWELILETTTPPFGPRISPNDLCLLPSSDSLLSHVEQLLRAFILKISVCDAVLDNNPPGRTESIPFIGRALTAAPVIASLPDFLCVRGGRISFLDKHTRESLFCIAGLTATQTGRNGD